MNHYKPVSSPLLATTLTFLKRASQIPEYVTGNTNITSRSDKWLVRCRTDLKELLKGLFEASKG